MPALLLLLGAAPALAHVGRPVAPASLLSEWSPDPLMTALLLAAAIAYGRGLARLWRRAGARRGIGFRQALCFWLGLAILAAALVSPLETATGTLLSAHMIQHVLLIAVAPPLLLLGRPDAALAFALPDAAKRRISAAGLFRALLSGLRRLARPMPAAFLHALAVWVWHAPGPFEAALANPVLHDLEHASFFVSALLFWQGVIVAARNPSLRLAGILATVVTLIQGGFLGALITLTGRPLYAAYRRTDLWGLTPLEDQQLAGLVMWVPAGAIYLGAGLLLAARLIGTDEPGRGPSSDPAQSVPLPRPRPRLAAPVR